ncbi:class I adenylate-forming enzyme family protein [Dactylosporangium sp. CA-092794]|uniref:class I adenylate-forming enzyme family protein n=1 Tax=Dactylosporangium sp. CA-092794 TaxID=3239929 RepID=UPI003D89D1C8
MAATQEGARTWAALVAGQEASAPAVVTAAGALSHGDLVTAAGHAAAWLTRHGAAPGVPVAALLPSSRAAFALAVAGALTGRPLAPLNPRATVRELVECVRGLPDGLVVATPEHAGLGQAVADAAGRRLGVVTDLGSASAELNWQVDAAGPVAIVHTSGTTGRPKPVTLRQDRLAARTRVFAGIVRLGPGSVFTSGSPFHHIAGVGMFLTALAAGAAMAEFPGFSESAWAGMHRLGVTHALLVPTMIEKLLAAGQLGLDTLRSLQYGASPIRAQTVRELHHALPRVRLTQLFGQTEGSPITALTHEHHLLAGERAPELLTSVGRAVPGLELRVDAPDERGVGQLHARAPHLFGADEHGWLHTGDLGRMTPDGFVYLLGRIGDTIIRGGENVYPVEVERVIGEHPAVSDVAVVGRPDATLGETVQAFVVLAGGAAVTADELRAHTRDALSGYKVPTDWQFVAELPRSAAGKVLRRQLRREAS